MDILNESQIEAEGGSCWWFKLSEGIGVKLFKRSYMDATKWIAHAEKEAYICSIVAGQGLAPKVMGTGRFRFRDQIYVGLVMERIRGKSGIQVEREDSDLYYRIVKEARTRLEGVQLKDVLPKNTMFVKDRVYFIDFGPVIGSWPKVEK